MLTPGEGAYTVVLNKTSVFVPMLEKTSEDILHSRPREGWFKNPSANPDRVIVILADMIQYTGEEIALEQASKLLKIDEPRFDLWWSAV